MAIKRTPVGADTETNRKRRPPIFDQRDRMAFPRDPAYYRVWVTDIKNQVQDFLDSGFTFVKCSDIGWSNRGVGEGSIESGSRMESRVSLKVGRADIEDNADAYLMQIPIGEWESMKRDNDREKQEIYSQLKRDIKSMARQQGFYVPDGLEDGLVQS